jgi:hypothetical protein
METSPVFELQRHQDTIRRLADALGTSVDVVQSLYQKELERLTPEARVKDFLSVLVARRVKARLLQQA